MNTHQVMSDVPMIVVSIGLAALCIALAYRILKGK